MYIHISAHDAEVLRERVNQCPRCRGTGVETDFFVSGMHVVAPCRCPLGGRETTICEIGNPRAAQCPNRSRHRRASNVAGRPKTNEAYWRRVRPVHEVLGEMEC